MRKGACIMFTVMDHDVLTSNDFAGEGFLPLKSVYGICKKKKSGHLALTPLALPLLNPRDGEGKKKICNNKSSEMSHLSYL